MLQRWLRLSTTPGATIVEVRCSLTQTTTAYSTSCLLVCLSACHGVSMPLRGLYLVLLTLIDCSVCLTLLLTSGSGVSPVLLCFLLLPLFLCLMLPRAQIRLISPFATSSSPSSQASHTSPRRRRHSRRSSRPHPYIDPTASYASTSPSSNEQQHPISESPTSTSATPATWDSAVGTPLTIQSSAPLLLPERADPLQANDASAFPALSDGRYRLLRTLQSSLFGCVKLAEVQETGARVCIKISCLYRSTLGVTVSGVKVEEDVQREGKLLHHLHSVAAPDEPGKDGIVELVEQLRDEQYYYLVLGDAGCDLYVYLKRLPVLQRSPAVQFIEAIACVSEEVARDIFCQLIAAVQFCHRHHVTINDLSLENVCIDSTGRVRLIDLGLAAIHPMSPHHPDHAARSTQSPLPVESPPIDAYFPVTPLQESGPLSGKLHYMSSEKFTRQPHCAYSADLYACAIILFTLLTGRPPYNQPLPSDWFWCITVSGRWRVLGRSGGGSGGVEGLDERERRSEVMCRELFGWMSDELMELLDGMIKKEERRWNWQQVNACKWVQDGTRA